MIRAEKLTKRFDDILAVDGITAEIRDGAVFGLLGTNGAGKSTFLRMVAGIYKADGGSLLVDEEPVFENPAVKQKLFYVSDDQYFFSNATPKEMMQYYQKHYPGFDSARYQKLVKDFGLDEKRKVKTFSKGMKKQLSMLLALCAGTEYILCDETFDGLDPVMRQTVKSLLAEDMTERKLTPIIASHNLRELEDICDHVGLLHRGGILLSKDLDDMKTNIHKLQCVLQEGMTLADLKGLEIIHQEVRGSLITMTVRGSREDVLFLAQSYHPVFCELIPLTLEEIFISETEVAGYDIKSLIF